MTVQRRLPLLLLLFVGSGCAALVYEVAWFQMLQLVIGSSGISLGVLLGVFMGGMFLGSLGLARFVSAERDPLRVYAAIELGIGILGILILVLWPVVGRVYVGLPHGPLSVLWRTAVAGALLIPPTLLMGATLPAISRHVEATPRGVAWMGFFYGGNIAGAVAGALLAGLYLLPSHDVVVATAVAASLNFLVAFVAYGMAKGDAADPPAPVTSKVTFHRRFWPVYVAIGLSGLTALGAQVVWTRLLSLLLGPTTYTFSIILAVFLTGLGVGSGGGSYLAGRVGRPRSALAACQLLLVGAVTWSAYQILVVLPEAPLPALTDGSVLSQLRRDLFRVLVAVLPAALLWGASFPLAVGAAAEPDQDPARLMGGVYAANTLGAIVGALGFALIALPALGTQGAQRAILVSAFVSGLLLLLGPGPSREAGPRARRWLGAGAAGVITALLLTAIPAPPAALIAYGRKAGTLEADWSTLYVAEGMNASIAVTERNGGRSFHVSGKVVASTGEADMRLQRFLGHTSALLHENPRSVLVVGFGAGVTAGSFVVHPSIERIVIVEIEPLITGPVSEYFVEAHHDVLRDPRVEVVHDDARHFLATTDERFDVITSDPIHPWVKGAAALYTEEYFRLATEHLNPGGVITQWVPVYESSLQVVQNQLATFFSVFPTGTLWHTNREDFAIDLILAARPDGLSIDVVELDARLRAPDHERVIQSLVDVGYPDALAYLSAFAGRAEDLEEWLEPVETNRDRSLRLMYMAGLALDADEAPAILRAVLARRSFPDDLFVGPPEAIADLRIRMRVDIL